MHSSQVYTLCGLAADLRARVADRAHVHCPGFETTRDAIALDIACSVASYLATVTTHCIVDNDSRGI